MYYDEARLPIGAILGAINTLDFKDGGNFSAEALSYGFPRLDIVGAI